MKKVIRGPTTTVLARKFQVETTTAEGLKVNSGYSPKDNAKIICANNNQWYSDKDYKQINELDSAKVDALLECITCSSSWEDIKDMYRSTGIYSNEVIVGGMDSQVNLEGDFGRFK